MESNGTILNRNNRGRFRWKEKRWMTITSCGPCNRACRQQINRKFWRRKNACANLKALAPSSSSVYVIRCQGSRLTVRPHPGILWTAEPRAGMAPTAFYVGYTSLGGFDHYPPRWSSACSWVVLPLPSLLVGREHHRQVRLAWVPKVVSLAALLLPLLFTNFCFSLSKTFGRTDLRSCCVTPLYSNNYSITTVYTRLH